MGSATGKETKRNSREQKESRVFGGVVVVNPHPRVRSATTLPPARSLSTPSFLRLSSSLASPLFFSVYISSFLKFLNIRSIGSRSLGKNRVGRHEMSTVGTAVSPVRHPAPRPPSRTHRRCFRQDLSVFHRGCTADAPARLRINYSISVRRFALVSASERHAGLYHRARARARERE